MYPTLQDINLLKQHHQQKYTKIEIIDRNTDVVIESIEGDMLSDSGTIDRSSSNRRSYNVDFRIKDSSYLVGIGNKIWFDKDIRVYTGILDKRSGEIIWYIIGTFVISEPNYHYDPDNNTLSLSLYDKMSLLDGSLGGKVMGAKDITITKYVDDLYYSKVEIADNAWTTLTGGVTLTIPIPQYVRGGDNSDDKVINTMSININADTTKQANLEKPLYKFSYRYLYPDGTVQEIEDMVYSTGKYVYTLTDIEKYQIKEIRITMMQSVNMKYIYLYDNKIAWWFSKEDKNIVREDFSNEFQVCGYRDSHYWQDATIKAVTISNGQVWNVGEIIVDARYGEEIFLKEVIKAGLYATGIDKYEIKNIDETIPYDQEFGVDISWYDIFETLIGLYTDIEMYFDEYGVFILQHYSTIEDDDIVLDYETLSELITSEDNNYSFSEVHNVSEVWGESIDCDVYSENTDEQPDNVKFKNNNFNVMFRDYLNDADKIPDNTVLAFKTPVDMPTLSKSPTLTINNLRVSVANITNIRPMFTCDDLKTSTGSKTGYKIDEDTTYAVDIGGIKIYTEDIRLDEGHKNKYIPDDGEDGWSRYGARSANKYYTANGVHITIDNTIGTNSNPIELDGIQFEGTFYNMLNASSMVHISDEGEYSIDLNKRKYCICMDVKEGEIYRIYYTHLNGYLYAADSNGIFKSENRPFVDYEAKNGINYSDFIAPSTGKYYIFWYGTETDDISFRLYGMSQIYGTNNEYPILNYTTELPVDYSIFAPNSSYCFEFMNNKIYYLGQWQVHAVAVEVLSVPTRGSTEYNEYVNMFNTSNITFTQYDFRLAIENIGIKTQILSGEEYENIYSDDLALQRASYENWKALRIADKPTLEVIQIPWLDVNEKVTYKQQGMQLKTYTTERISFSNSSETMTIELSAFYPLYIEKGG